jgi:hypothetical protein
VGRTVLIAACLAILPQGTLSPQSLISVGYGQNTDEATGVATGENLTLGYALFRPAAGIAASAGLPTDSETGVLWGTLTGWLDRALGRSAWQLSASGTGFVFEDPVLDDTGTGSIVALDVHRAFQLERVELGVRLGGRHGSQRLAGETHGRLLGRVGGRVGVTRGLLTARADLDHWRADDGGYTQPSARVILRDPRFQAWAGVAGWLESDVDGTGWELGARVALTPRVALTAWGGVQPEDILFWIPPRRSWSLGIQLRTGPDPLAAAVAVPVLDGGDRRITLALPAAGVAGQPAVAGSFSDWRPVPMQRSNAEWRIELVLEPGVHEYSFVDGDGQWFVPSDTPGRKPDGFGGHVAVIIVQ